MIKRYVSTDIPAIRAFLQSDPDLMIQFNAGLQSVDMLYFDIWLSRDDAGRLTAVLFRSYGDFYLKATSYVDPEELAGFFHFLPMLYTLSCHSETAEELLPLLYQVRGQASCTVAVQPQAPPPLSYELNYHRAQSMDDYRSVYDLLAVADNLELTRFDDYYYLRRNMEKSWTGRSYCLLHGQVAYATASTSGECPGLALVTDVATHPRFRRKGLGFALMTALCRDLHEVGKLPHVIYQTEVAASFYERLGFEPLYDFTRITFDSPGVPVRKLF